MNDPAVINPETPRAMVPTGSTPGDLLMAAVANGANMETLERLMALQRDWEANEARKAFVKSMAAFKCEPMVIEKRAHVEYTTRDGDTTSYEHAKLSDCTAVIVPALARNGMSHRWDVKQETGLVTVTCIITHALGHSESTVMFAPPDDSGKKNKIQQIASTVSYLQRYTLLAATGMATTDMDDDGRGAFDNANDQQPDAAEKALLAWLDAINECNTEAELKARKGQCVLAYKTVEQIPQRIMTHFVNRSAAIKANKTGDKK